MKKTRRQGRRKLVLVLGSILRTVWKNPWLIKLNHFLEFWLIK
ncbi:MAG: hypothetical protein MRECE_8c027 [Mycoplasmataceae bacterium CE_OT135]|nr:MAG: hypothetical protein MRECE_8c027 [Mycoplasmataceae bacterium CE_OT135]